MFTPTWRNDPIWLICFWNRWFNHQHPCVKNDAIFFRGIPPPNSDLHFSLRKYDKLPRRILLCSGIFQVCFKIGFSFCCWRLILQKSGQSVEMYETIPQKREIFYLFQLVQDVFHQTKMNSPTSATPDIESTPPARGCNRGKSSGSIQQHLGVCLKESLDFHHWKYEVHHFYHRLIYGLYHGKSIKSPFNHHFGEYVFTLFMFFSNSMPQPAVPLVNPAPTQRPPKKTRAESVTLTSLERWKSFQKPRRLLRLELNWEAFWLSRHPKYSKTCAYFSQPNPDSHVA